MKSSNETARVEIPDSNRVGFGVGLDGFDRQRLSVAVDHLVRVGRPRYRVHRECCTETQHHFQLQ